jgi:hypothetical protein
VPIQLLDGVVVVPFATAAGGIWPVLTGSVSPAPPAKVRAQDAKFRMLSAKISGAASEDEAGKAAELLVKAQAKYYAEHLKAWNIDKPISAESIATLPYELFIQLDVIVTGQGGLILGNSEGTSQS